jgi:serine/threonine protein kinase/Tol biopolymer transport system component
MDVLADALELEASARPAFLERACAGDVDLKVAVEKLLAAERAAKSAIPEAHPASAAIKSVAVDHAPPPPGEEKDLLGTTLGPYTFKEVIGQGGMGVVYRARDSRLDRDVAIKALPPSLSADPYRLNRLLREARILAQLSHPNVATIFGLEESPTGGKFVVMEMMVGNTLSRRLSRGALPMQEALEIAAKICAGVEAAHAAGVVHRDLKPGNIMLTAEGMVKVMDFGIARDAHRHDIRGVNQSWTPGLPTHPPANAPTQAALTREGAIMGTPGYMPPEQLRGQKVDKRADVFAFGCILYEMISGTNAFAGNTTEELDRSVLEHDPEWTRLPPRTPTNIRRLLTRCLSKDPDKRLRDLGDARLDIEEALVTREWSKPQQRDRAKAQPLQWLGFILALTFGAISLALYLRPRSTTALPDYRTEQFAIRFPNDQGQTDLSRLRLALSRNGDRLAISAFDGRQQQLFLRNRGELEFKPVEGTDEATLPGFSPDGQWLAYFSAGTLMKRRIDGSAAVKVSDHCGYFGRFSWSTEDQLTHAPEPAIGLARVKSSGGAEQFITTPNPQAGEFAHLHPTVTPDNRWLLYSVWNGRDAMRIDARNLTSGEFHQVIANASNPRVVNTPLGTHLVFARGPIVMAAKFDSSIAQVIASEQPVVDGVLSDRAMLTPVFDVADDGTLAYVSGSEFDEQSRLLWMTSDGGVRVFSDDRAAYAEPHFSSNGAKLSVLIKSAMRRPHIVDLRSGRWDRVVVDGDVSTCCISPDGTQMVYSGNQQGTYRIYLRDLASGEDRVLLAKPTTTPQQLHFSSDGSHVVFAMSNEPGSPRDIWLINLESAALTRFTTGVANECSPRFSPDGKWIAYVSEESGRREVRVRAFPSGSPDRQISNSGGDSPEWSPRAARLIFRSGSSLLTVDINKDDGTAMGRSSIIYNRRFGQADFDLASYTTAPDGKLLLIEPSEKTVPVNQINVIVNWFARLKETK